jgi:glycyl-tRNA synthetase
LTSLKEETLRRWFSKNSSELPSVLAPTKAAVLPLVKKTVDQISHLIIEDLRWDFNVTYEKIP